MSVATPRIPVERASGTRARTASPAAGGRLEPWAALQSQIGNRAIARLVDTAREQARPKAPLRRKALQREPDRDAPQEGEGWARSGWGTPIVRSARAVLDGPLPRLRKAPDVATVLQPKLSALLTALTADERAQWQRVADHQVAFDDLAAWDQSMRAALQVTYGDAWTAAPGYERWLRRMQAQLPKAPPQTTLTVDPLRFVEGDIYKVAVDRYAELQFRNWALKQIAAKPITIDLARVFRYREANAVHVMALGRYNEKGRITAADLEREFPDEYRTRVWDRPEVRQLRSLAHELTTIYYELQPEHVARSQMNKKYSGLLGFVRHISEALGEGSEPYPSLALWTAPKAHLDRGRELLEGRDIEAAAGELMLAHDKMLSIAGKFSKYENRVQTGAGVAVKWLGRLKVAGSIAAGLAGGPLGLMRASLVAGGYTFVQEGAQQASSVATGQQDEMKWGDLAKAAGISTAMSLFGGAIQTRFKSAILSRMGAADDVAATAVDDFLASQLASATASVYQLPVQLALEKVVNGKAFPKDASEFADLVLDSVAENAMTDAVTTVTTRLGRKPSATPTADALGAELFAEGARTKTGPADATAKTGTATGPDAAGKVSHAADVKGPSGGDPAAVPDNRFETGLMSKDAKLRIAQGAFQAFEQARLNNPKGLSGIELVRARNEIRGVLAGEVARTGMPMPEVVFSNDPPYIKGGYSSEKHRIMINRNFDGWAKPDGFQRLLGTMVHETRHAEQIFTALRVRAGEQHAGEPTGKVAAELANETHVDALLARAAAERPIEANSTTKEAALGREIWSESFRPGPRRDLADWAQKAVGRRGEIDAKLNELSDRIVESAIRHGNAKNAKAILERLHKFRSELKLASDHYFRLAEEIDARRVQLQVEHLFDIRLQMQTSVNRAREHAAAAEEAFFRLLPYDASAKAAYENLLQSNRALADRIAELLKAFPTGT